MLIDKTFIHGWNFTHGANVIIEPDVVVGNNVKLGHNVTLKRGTRILDDVDLADYVKTTGLCIIGNGVTARTDACISKGVIVNDNCFIGPGVMTNHTKNVIWKRNLPDVQLVTNIGYGVILGSHCSVLAGINIAPNITVAAGTNVYKDLTEIGVYGGNPARKIKDQDSRYILELGKYIPPYQFERGLLRKYLPGVQL